MLHLLLYLTIKQVTSSFSKHNLLSKYLETILEVIT